ncbi:MAG: riboflavin biosynthesis protein RibF [Candidatus Zixiibacteriota bacterium]
MPCFDNGADAAAHLQDTTVTCVGTFDGVHLGHQAILRRGRALADEMHLPMVALSFHPHPKTIVHPERAPHLLTEPDERVALFAAYGTDCVIMLRFDHQLAQTTARDFADTVLARYLQAAAVVVGADFGFGHDRQGNAEFLRAWGRERGCPVEVVGMVPSDRAGEAVSSSVIRRCLEAGDFDRAVRLLGHPYPASGPVRAGAGRGKQLGYPTWNLALSDVKLAPPVGIYAGWTGRPIPRPAMAYYGVAPTFAEQTVRLEVHVLEGDEDERTPQDVEMIWLAEFIRPDVRFAGSEDLRQQLSEDERTVRAWANRHKS